MAIHGVCEDSTSVHRDDHRTINETSSQHR
jgi:hypothetical protein